MSKQYEYITLDGGHEYVKPCEVLFDTKLSWFIKLGEVEHIVSKQSANPAVRQVGITLNWSEKLDTIMDEMVEGTIYSESGQFSCWIRKYNLALSKAGMLNEDKTYER